MEQKLFNISRRSLLKQLGSVPLLLRASSLSGGAAFASANSWEQNPFADSNARYTPHYPSASPLEDVLRLVTPGLDEYATEKQAHEIELTLAEWTDHFKGGTLSGLAAALHPSLQASSLTAGRQTQLRHRNGIDSFKTEFSQTTLSGAQPFLDGVQAWLAGAQVEDAVFELTSIQPSSGEPASVHTQIRFSLVLRGTGTREQRVGTWHVEWVSTATHGQTGWQITRLLPLTENRALLRGRGFVDVSKQALGGTASYAGQMLHGSDYWRTVLDGACGIDVYGNNGVSVGDFDNDGFDDLYVSQPAGLPNRLYRNRGDGTFEDVTEKAGVGVLDNTACALFADLRNKGVQDLIVVCGGGPLLFLNDGDGRFTLKPDAFRFDRPPEGTFTHAALADYDRDGKLDVYFCVYSYYLGLDQYHYPTPYFDARNGPPNFLMHNEGDGTFVDRTQAAGLHVENDRYSFACAWGGSRGDALPDLYVVNDFGRNNLYRNRGDGTFEAVSAEAHVQDVGAGMSAAWGDYNDDGRSDLYVANMWSAAGQRVSQQAIFHAGSSAATRSDYQRHAQGNALYRNRGDGTFENVSQAAGVEVGRWAWGSDFWDLDHDGYPDLYVTNGYITAPAPGSGGKTSTQQIDLGSFFWRQVVARSPDDATPSVRYEHGWNALNELIRTDSSWNGRERNVLLANNGDGTFSEIAGALRMDFLEDGRSFALADFDHDGRLEVVVKNRSAPQLRLLHNSMDELGDSIIVRLRGTRSNRDAIGTVVTLHAGERVQTRSLQAGSGFLAQHTKELSFGLGDATGALRATIHWPSGLTQEFANLPRNHRIELVEGTADFLAKPFQATAGSYANAQPRPVTGPPETLPTTFGTWLIDPLKAPDFHLPGLRGEPVSLDSRRGHFVLLYLWSTGVAGYQQQLQALESARASSGAIMLEALAMNVDPASSADQARASVAKLGLSYPVLFATEEVGGRYNIVYRYLFDRRADLVLPTSFLLDRAGMIVKIYQGQVSMKDVVADVRSLPTTKAERMARALPFAGTLHQGEFLRNDFTYGVAMFQHGYLEEAAQSFEQVIAAHPRDAEAYYNLGTLHLRRNDFAQARKQLQQAVELKPNYPEALNNLGMLDAQQGHREPAIQNFERSLSLRPTYATALQNLGNLYRHEQNFAEAETYLKRALALQPDDPETNYSLGMLHAQQNQSPIAQTYLERAIALRPAYPEALNNLGVLFVREQKYAKAEQQFLTCARLVPTYESTYLNLARLYLVENERAKARAALEALLRVRPDSEAGRQALRQLEQAP